MSVSSRIRVRAAVVERVVVRLRSLRLRRFLAVAVAVSAWVWVTLVRL